LIRRVWENPWNPWVHAVNAGGCGEASIAVGKEWASHLWLISGRM